MKSLTAHDFRNALQREFTSAERAGRNSIEISSGDLHRKVGSYPGARHSMPTCCNMMREALGTLDTVLSEPRLGRGATLTIRYAIPRPTIQLSDQSLISDVTCDWFWEGNVVSAVTRYLSSNGWRIESTANTHSKEHGVDILAVRESSTLLVEAKGYPSNRYRDPRRAGKEKPTSPGNQANHWYSHALLKALRLQNQHSQAIVALALPDFPRYRILHEETRCALKTLGIALLFVEESGEVRIAGIEF